MIRKLSFLSLFLFSSFLLLNSGTAAATSEEKTLLTSLQSSLFDTIYQDTTTHRPERTIRDGQSVFATNWMYWIDSDGTPYLLNGSESIYNFALSDKEVESWTGENQLAAIPRVREMVITTSNYFLSQGLQRNQENDGTDQDSVLNYQLGFEKGDIKCTIMIRPGIGYLTQENNGPQYMSVDISCGSGLEDIKNKLYPFMKDLNLLGNRQQYLREESNAKGYYRFIFAYFDEPPFNQIIVGKVNGHYKTLWNQCGKPPKNILKKYKIPEEVWIHCLNLP